MHIKEILGLILPNKKKQSKSNVAYSYEPITRHDSDDRGSDVTSDYRNITKRSFMSNVVAHRAITMIARSASCVSILLYSSQDHPDGKIEMVNHPAMSLLNKPLPTMDRTKFLEMAMMHQMLDGNVYIKIVKDSNGIPTDLQILRPDRVKIISDGEDLHYHYTINKHLYVFKPDIHGFSDIMHLKYFHPLNDLYGLSSLVPAANAIEQHNKCIMWNKSLLENGARPSGAIVVNNNNNNIPLNDIQFDRLKAQIQNQLASSSNAGRIMLLENGMTWQDMSVSPKDMDFIETKNSAARDIALALGVPPQLLGIKGDNTYNNMAEARLALWEETVLPLLSNFCSSLSIFLSHHFNESLCFEYDPDSVLALSERRVATWDNVKNADFLTKNEKRAMLGFDTIDNKTFNM